MRFLIPTIVVLIALVSSVSESFAQQSRCADCHFANLSPRFATHLSDWERSAHGRTGVACERCHDGDPTTFEPLVAHRGILNWMNPASSVHRANLPRTCGACHAGPLAAFQKSRHFALLQGGNPVVPTCTTCHGYAGENRPSPKALESVCAMCHRAGQPDGHPEHPALGRKMLEGVREGRALLKEARGLIGRIKDQARRAGLERAAQQIDVPLTQATQAGHAFVYDDLEAHLDTARQRLAALFEALANPPRP